MTRSATHMARLKEAAQYFPVYTRPTPGEFDDSYSLRRGCFACQHTGKSSLHDNHRFATVWFHAINTGKDVDKLIQPLGAVVIDLMDTASVGAKDNSILHIVKNASTTFPKLWIYYISTQAFKDFESPYVRLIADRRGNVDHINSRLSLWKNLLTKEEQNDMPTDITLTIQGNWGRGLYIDPSSVPAGLQVKPEQLITANKGIQVKLLQALQGEQQLTRIEPYKEPTKTIKKPTFGAKAYGEALHDVLTQNTHTWATPSDTGNAPMWTTFTTEPDVPFDGEEQF